MVCKKMFFRNLNMDWVVFGFKELVLILAGMIVACG